VAALQQQRRQGESGNPGACNQNSHRAASFILLRDAVPIVGPMDRKTQKAGYHGSHAVPRISVFDYHPTPADCSGTVAQRGSNQEAPSC
jgi:hypothetical protein